MSREKLISALARIAELSASLKHDRDAAQATLKRLNKVPSTPEQYAGREEKLRKQLGNPDEIQDVRAREAIKHLIETLDSLLQSTRQSFVRELRDQAKSRGIEAELKDSVFFAMKLRLLPDLARGHCDLHFANEVVEKGLPLDADRCLDSLSKHSKRLLDARDSPAKVLASLNDAYLGTCGQRQIAPGDYAPIIDVLSQM